MCIFASSTHVVVVVTRATPRSGRGDPLEVEPVAVGGDGSGQKSWLGSVVPSVTSNLCPIFPIFKRRNEPPERALRGPARLSANCRRQPRYLNTAAPRGCPSANCPRGCPSANDPHG